MHDMNCFRMLYLPDPDYHWIHIIIRIIFGKGLGSQQMICSHPEWRRRVLIGDNEYARAPQEQGRGAEVCVRALSGFSAKKL